MKEGSNAYLNDALSNTVHGWRCTGKNEDFFIEMTTNILLGLQSSINKTPQNVDIIFTSDYDKYACRTELTQLCANKWICTSLTLFWLFCENWRGMDEYVLRWVYCLLQQAA